MLASQRLKVTTERKLTEDEKSKHELRAELEMELRH